MKSRILLVNFTEKEAEKIRSLDMEVELGYITDAVEVTPEEVSFTRDKERSYISNAKADSVIDKIMTKGKEYVDFYFPHPIYEYKVAVFNLNRNSEASKRFGGETKNLTTEVTNEIMRFWLRKGIIVVFLGDYNWKSLIYFGISWLSLVQVKEQDETCKFLLDEETGFRKMLKKLKSHVEMPTEKYIHKRKMIFPSTSEHSLKPIYGTLGDKMLGCYYNKLPAYQSDDLPRFILLPKFKNNIMVVEPILRELAKIYTSLLPEIYEPDWVDSEKYYPREVSTFDKKMFAAKAKIKKEVDALYTEKEIAKKKWADLRGLLCNRGDKLKSNVIQVLRNIFKLSAKDADEEKKNIFAEDILISYQNRKILAEVKGTSAENPSPALIGQVWKHIAKSEDKIITEGMLILNHDLKTDPKDRSLAYAGVDEKDLINDIIFVDTRVLYQLAIAIIDYSIPLDEARTILLQKGRVSFDLDKYLKGKSS